MLPIFVFISASAMLAVIIVPTQAAARRAGRTKLSRRKCHLSEHRTGIVLAGLHAFLIRHAVFRCLNQILRRTNNADNRKDTQRYRQITILFPVRQGPTHAVTNRLGNLAAATAAMALMLLFANASSQNDGINDLRSRYMIGK